MSNNSINILIKNINRQRPALNKKIKNGESVVERNEKKLKIFKNLKGVIEDVIKLYESSEKSVTFYKGELNTTHLKAERTRITKWISITEKKIELITNKLSYAKLLRDAINDEFKNKNKNKNHNVKLRKLSSNINKALKNNFKG